MNKRPNIVIIMTDQQRADLSAREGYELNTTPFLAISIRRPTIIAGVIFNPLAPTSERRMIIGGSAGSKGIRTCSPINPISTSGPTELRWSIVATTAWRSRAKSANVLSASRLNRSRRTSPTTIAIDLTTDLTGLQPAVIGPRYSTIAPSCYPDDSGNRTQYRRV